MLLNQGDECCPYGLLVEASGVEVNGTTFIGERLPTDKALGGNFDFNQMLSSIIVADASFCKCKRKHQREFAETIEIHLKRAGTS
jgi:hypothetical protein